MTYTANTYTTLQLTDNLTTMKKTILLTSLLLITILSFGQNKRYHTNWYNYSIKSVDAGIVYDTIFTTLFPDSTVISRIVDDSGNALVGNVNLHSIGQVFDPKYEFFSNPDAAGKGNSYIVDSIRFKYKYHHTGDSSVDTLRIQFYLNAQVTKVNFSNGGSSYSVQYNWQNNSSTLPNFRSEIKVLLDSSNNTKGEYKTMSLAVPEGDLFIYQNKLCAYTLSYIPGFNFNSGDTIDYYLNPQKALNQFSPLILTDKYKFPDQQPDKSGNTGLFINTVSRYNLPNNGWLNLYIPGHAYPIENRHLASGFHAQLIGNVTSLYSLTELYIYPNPLNNTQELNIEFELTKQEELSITITDITGRTVKEFTAKEYQQGKHHLSADLTGLSRGMYYVSVINSDGARTAKPIIIN